MMSNLHFLKNDIINALRMDFMKIKEFDQHISETEVEEKLIKLLTWLSTTPKNLVFRINTILCEQQVAYDCIAEALKQYSRPLPTISTFPCVTELIVVNHWNDLDTSNLIKLPNEVIVDAACGAAVLRGAHIFAPGVLGMPKGLSIGDKISVYADIKHVCKRGLIVHFNDEYKTYIGNGIVKLTREQIFNQDAKNVAGVAIYMTDIISCLPQLNEDILPKGHVLLQNLPSVICSRILDPQPGENVLDMCAAPGNKTTHIAALMKNKGVVIALEKIKSKLQKLNLNIHSFSTSIIKAFCFDSTKAVSESKNQSVLTGPPFTKETFDKVLLDGPCSALGQRPQLYNPISVPQLHSYVPLQRKLFTAAVQLLKPGGTLVYSTCTITIAENEGIISWALSTFPNLDLQDIKQKLKNWKMEEYITLGYNIDGLTVEQSNKLCRFGHESNFVGFFIACFVKR